MRSKKIFLLFSLLLFVSCSKAIFVEDISGTRMVKVNTSKEKDTHLILDVRPYHSYKNGHLEFAINIPKSELERRIVEIMDFKDMPVYVYGKNADSSFPATEILVRHGFQTVYNAEGIDEFAYELVHFDTIRVYTVRNSINSDSFFLIDYRTKTSYNAEHFKNAINIPIGEKITITPRVFYLTTDGSNIPETYRPKMGGIRTADNSLEFAGMPADKIRGNSIFVGSLKAQYNVSKLVYLDTTYSRANISQKSYRFGTEEKESYKFGLGVKALSIPLYFGFAKVPGESWRYIINFGYSPE